MTFNTNDFMEYMSQASVTTAATIGSVVNHSVVVVGAAIDAYQLVRELGADDAALRMEQYVSVAVNTALGRK